MLYLVYNYSKNLLHKNTKTTQNNDEIYIYDDYYVMVQ